MKKTILLGVVLVAAVKMACGQQQTEQTLRIGSEGGSFFNNGSDTIAQVKRPILITSYDICVSELPNGTGFSDILAVVGFSPVFRAYTKHAATVFSEGPNSDFGHWANWGPVRINAAVGGNGTLTQIILKSSNGLESSKQSTRSGLNILVPAGWYIIIHMDHAGSVSADAEMQGVINYIPQ